MKCGKCVKPALIGSRCIRCYVVRQARRIGIAKSGWWLRDCDKFAELLYYRYLALSEGATPDVATVTKAFPKTDCSTSRHVSRIAKITAIVATFDRMVRRQHDARAESAHGAHAAGAEGSGELDDHRGP